MYCWAILDPDLGTVKCRFFGVSLYYGTAGGGRGGGGAYSAPIHRNVLHNDRRSLHVVPTT